MSVDGYTASYTLNNEALEAGASFALGKNTGSNGNGDTIVITNTAEESGGYVLPSTGGACRSGVRGLQKAQTRKEGTLKSLHPS